MSAHFACLSVFIYMYWTKWLHPSVLNKRACRSCSVGPPSTAFPGHQRQVFCGHPFGTACPAAGKGRGFETIASPGCGLVSVKSGRVQGVDLDGWGRLLHGDGWAQAPAQPGGDSGALSGTRRCLAWLSRCEAWGAWGDTCGTSVYEAQGQGPSPGPAVVQYLHKVVLAQPGEAPVLCGVGGHKTLTQPTCGTGGQSKHLEIKHAQASLRWGRWKRCPSALLPVIMRLQKGCSSVLHPWTRFLQGPLSSAAALNLVNGSPFLVVEGHFTLLLLRWISEPVPSYGSTLRAGALFPTFLWLSCS